MLGWITSSNQITCKLNSASMILHLQHIYTVDGQRKSQKKKRNVNDGHFFLCVPLSAENPIQAIKSHLARELSAHETFFNKKYFDLFPNVSQCWTFLFQFFRWKKKDHVRSLVASDSTRLFQSNGSFEESSRGFLWLSLIYAPRTFSFELKKAPTHLHFLLVR